MLFKVTEVNMIDYKQMTQKVREAFQAAQALSAEAGHQQIDGEHLLLALLRQDDGLAPQLFERMDASTATAIARLEQELAKMPSVSGPGSEAGKIYVTPRLDKLLAVAQKEMKKMGDQFLSVEHLLLAFADESGSDSGKILNELGITRNGILEALKTIRGSQRGTSDNPEGAYDALTKYGQDLVELARNGKLDPVIGRDAEIRSVIRILSRKTKNNPVLIGEPGVGKTAIVEGLAHRIVRGDVPEGLKEKTIFALDMTSLMAGGPRAAPRPLHDRNRTDRRPSESDLQPEQKNRALFPACILRPLPQSAERAVHPDQSDSWEPECITRPGTRKLRRNGRRHSRRAPELC